MPIFYIDAYDVFHQESPELFVCGKILFPVADVGITMSICRNSGVICV